MVYRKKGRIALREQELTKRDGALYRADRIVIDSKMVTVVDFKTGGDENESEYIVQVRNYMVMLKEIYPDKEVGGCIAYVDLKQMRSRFMSEVSLIPAHRKFDRRNCLLSSLRTAGIIQITSLCFPGNVRLMRCERR